MARPTLETATDLAEFFTTDDFAITATYTPDGGSSASVKGIFDEGYQAVEIGGEVAVANVSPQFSTQSSEVSSASKGDAIVCNSVTYTVVNVQPDGTGVTTLILERN